MLCPNCQNWIIDTNATECPTCGFELPVSLGETIDPSEFLGPANVETTDFELSQEAEDAEFVLKPADDANGSGSDLIASDALGSTTDFEPKPGGTFDSGGTMDLDDPSRGTADFSLDMDPPIGGTAELPEKPVGTVDMSNKRSQTVRDDGPASTIHMDDGTGTVAQHGTMTPGGTIVQSTAPYEDSQSGTRSVRTGGGTILDSGSGSGTISLGPEGGKPGSGGSDSGGTASTGHLERIWKGAIDSDKNLGATLKAAVALASDSIFEKVVGRGLVTDSVQSILEHDVKDVKDREMVKGLVEVACTDSAKLKTADYTITGYLGRGSFGAVLKATQNSVHRDVALKMLKSSSGTSSKSKSSTVDQQKKFLYEAQITGQLDHPNIVPVYDLGISNGVLFYAMKKIEGKEWDDVLEENSLEDNLAIWMKVCDALAFAHQKEIIHRDLKPANVMIGRFGEVLVTDWGLGVDLKRNEKFGAGGSPPWMAPEMAVRSQTKTRECSDIYLLGAILYQIIEGHGPHPGRSVMEVIHNAAKNVIIPPKKPGPLMDIAMKAMDTIPENRYETVEKLQDAIREYLKHNQSIELAERSDAMLEKAKESKDYDRFDRAMFGFSDAIDIWPENKKAAEGLRRARYAYGECALAKNDYGIVMTKVDRSIPDEDALYVQAEKAKIENDQRAARLRNMRRIAVGTTLVGLLGMSGFALYAQRGWSTAEEQEKIAITKKNEAEQLAISEKAAKEEAERLAISEKAAKEEAEQLAISEKAAKENAEQLAVSEKAAKEEAEQLAISEKAAKEEAERLAISESEARTLADQRNEKIERDVFPTNLKLAFSQINDLNVSGTRRTLDTLIDDPTSINTNDPSVAGIEDAFKTLRELRKLPQLQGWAWNRIHLLTNGDLRNDEPFWGDVTKFAFAPETKVGVVALRGKEDSKVLKIVGLNNDTKKLEVVAGAKSFLLPADLQALTISSDGSYIVYSTTSPGNGDSAIFRWRLDQDRPESLKTTATSRSRDLQTFVATKDHIVGGLNGGLWVWSNNSSANEDPRPITNIRGSLHSIQPIGDNQLLVVAEVNDVRHTHFVDLNRLQATHEPERISFESDKLAAAAYANGRLILGTQSGRLYSVSYTPLSGATIDPSDLKEIPRQHNAAIQSIVPGASGSLLTFSVDEPFVNVWQATESNLDVPSGFTHYQKLIGTTDNLSHVAFVSESDPVLIAGVARDGSIVWNPERQRQRQRVERFSDYDAPVIASVPCEDNRHVVSILANGKIDRWDTQTGRSIGQTQVPNDEASRAGGSLAFVGHSPQATFVDMAMDEEAGILITSAVLPRSQLVSTNDPSNSRQEDGIQREYEFVRWNLADGTMVDKRWTRSSSEEQTISLVSGGRFLLYGSDKETELFQFGEDGKAVPVFQSKGRPGGTFGSYYAYTNPKDDHLLMLVQLNGAVILMDTNDPAGSWMQDNRRFDQNKLAAITSKDDRVILGQWSPAGDAFYMIWDSGRVSEILWNGNQIQYNRSTDKSDALLRDTKDGKDTSYRIGSRWNVDMKVRSEPGQNVVYAVVRFPGNEPRRARLTKISFPMSNEGEKYRMAQSEDKKISAEKFLLTDDPIPRVQENAVKTVVAMRKTMGELAHDIAGVRTIGSNVYVVTGKGHVFRVNTENRRVDVFGQPKLLSATGDKSGNTIYTLHESGILRRAIWNDRDRTWNWSGPLGWPIPDGAKSISLSPDGKELLVSLDSMGVGLYSTDTGAPIPRLQEDAALVQATAWQPGNDNDPTLAIVLKDGRMKLVKRAGSIDIPVTTNIAASDVRDIHFFTEAWNSAEKPNTDWLVLHTIVGDGETRSQKLMYVPIIPVQVDGQAVKPVELSLPATTTEIECSPTEGLLVVGSKGTVTLYFAAPTLEETGKELFSLPGHTGSDITTLRFTQDGKTLISADYGTRQFGWLSNDKL